MPIENQDFVEKIKSLHFNTIKRDGKHTKIVTDEATAYVHEKDDSQHVLVQPDPINRKMVIE